MRHSFFTRLPTKICRLTPELSGGTPGPRGEHFIVHRRSNEMLADMAQPFCKPVEAKTAKQEDPST